MSQKQLKFKCDKCKKQFEEVWSFTQYGGEERKKEFEKNTHYCEKCFLVKEQEISKKT
jgi:hypothetical protein